MSLPRQVIPGATTMVSRRCDERRFLLRPDQYVTQVFLFLLAYAARECNILVHGFIVMSNHFHLLVTDPDGLLPVFMERLDSLLARSLNAYWGRWESFFAPDSYDSVRLATPEDCMSKLIYMLTNPVKAGLVDHARRWTGATSVRWHFGETRTFSRPDGQFFGPSSELPAEVSLTLAPLPGYEDKTPKELDALVRERLIARETELRAEFRAEGRPFAGMAEVLRCDPFGHPTTRERRRGMNPRIAGKDPEVRIGAIAELTGFRREHRKARLRYEGGDHSVVFPAGTWLMRVRYGVKCQPAPPGFIGRPPPPS
jgi:REP element-mobilizing transposase RayT